MNRRLANGPRLGYNIANHETDSAHLRAALDLAGLSGAAWLLYDRLKQYTSADPRCAGRHPAWHIAAAALLTLLNYAILVGYDWFAVRWVGEKDLPLRKIALASFTGYAFSYNFGATLFGTSIRYRLYSAWGVSLRKNSRPAGDPRADLLVRRVHAGGDRVHRGPLPHSQELRHD